MDYSFSYVSFRLTAEGVRELNLEVCFGITKMMTSEKKLCFGITKMMTTEEKFM